MIEDFSPDVVFLDVEMPGGTGFNLLESYSNLNFDVIFTTAHDSYALKAIKFAALDYLLKPINFNELLTSLKRLMQKYEGDRGSQHGLQQSYEVMKKSFNDEFNLTKIALPSSDGFEFIELSDIVRCEADRSYCNFHLTDRNKVVISKSLKEFEELLEEAGFYRVHKSNMINLSHVKKYVRGAGGHLIMSDDSHVTVSIRKKDHLLSLLSGR